MRSGQRPGRLQRQNRLNLGDEMIVDNFAGGGGASTGIERALGRPIDLAINHSPEAIAMHKANHPQTHHIAEDVWNVDPRIVTGGRPVGLAWFSPDCTYHSKARGGKPIREAGKKIRALAWVVVRWADTVRPRVIMLENVEEFEHWCPINHVTGRPFPDKKGMTFQHWKRRLEDLGYEVQHRQLIASEYGAPTSRKRFFVIARCDGEPIVWPQPTHGPGTGKAYRTAAQCIDWTIPTQSIFARSRPLAENTLIRIAKGIKKFVLDDPDPFIIDDHAAIISRIGQTGRAHNPARRVDEPLSTIVGKQEHLLIAPHLVKHFGGVTGIRIDRPFPTTTTRGTQNQIVTSHLMTMRNNVYGQDARTPLRTITSGGTHHAEVRAFLIKYYGSMVGQHQRPDEPIHTIPSKARYGLVTVAGQQYQIVDIGMRMLTPRELFTCQGFPKDYIIDPIFNGKPLTKTAQTKCCGNSVPPALSYALTTANYSEERRYAA